MGDSQVAADFDLWDEFGQRMDARASRMLKDDRSGIHLVGRGSRMEIQRGRQATLRTDDAKAGGLE